MQLYKQQQAEAGANPGADPNASAGGDNTYYNADYEDKTNN